MICLLMATQRVGNFDCTAQNTVPKQQSGASEQTIFVEARDPSHEDVILA